MVDLCCFIVTIYYINHCTTLECALSVKRATIGDHCADNPMDPVNRARLHNLLPLHVRSCGPILKVERLFDITVVPEYQHGR
jgi:hypothetical protein